MKKKKLVENVGDDLQLRYDKMIAGNRYINYYITLTPTNPITLYSVVFEWKGKHLDQDIVVSLSRNESETQYKISGNLPNEYDREFGTLHDQLLKELRRVLRQLN